MLDANDLYGNNLLTKLAENKVILLPIYALEIANYLCKATIGGFCDLIKLLYVREYDRLKADFKRINNRIEAVNKDIEQTRLEFENEDHGRLRIYSAEIIATKERERKELTYERQVAEERIINFPKMNMRTIVRSAQSYRQRLKDNKDNPRKIWLELINRIVVDNEHIRVVVNINALLGTDLPITLTILEKRDNVALRNGWKNLPTAFQEITVEIA